MKTYRLYTENKNANEVIEHVSHTFESFTYFTGIGYWKIQREDALILEFIGDLLGPKVTALAEWIKAHNNQQAVLVTVTPCDMVMI